MYGCPRRLFSAYVTPKAGFCRSRICPKLTAAPTCCRFSLQARRRPRLRPRRTTWVMKQDHPLAMEYIARLLRRTVEHNGPVKRHEIDVWLRRDAVAEFQAFVDAP